MGLTNFSKNDDDDDPNGPTGPGGPGGTSFSAMTGANDEAESFLVNYNEKFKNNVPLLFRDGVVSQMVSVLIAKTKPNPLLIGPAGVGKSALAEELARRIATGDPTIPARLKKSTVWELPMSNLVAGAGIVGQLEQRIALIVDYATSKKNDAILFIDEIHLLQGDDPIYKKVAQILKPALARGEMRLIGATTMNEAQNLAKDPAFQRRFTRLIVDELTREQTTQVLFAVRGSYLTHYLNKVTVGDDVLSKIALIADENARASSHRPDGALTLLDRAMADVVVSHSTAIAQATASGDQATAQALGSMASLPLSEKKVRSVAVKLMTGLATKEPYDEEKILGELTAIKGQQEILDDLIDALRRDSIGAFPRIRPMAWMFAGPSGVGKTQVAKIIAQELTGQAPIILNMNEFHTKWDTSKILGSPPGYIGSESDRELPFDTLESNPYRVILLDEIEKADKAVHRLFLNALDEGWMRMANGKVIDFSKSLIIATTNAAREALNKAPVGFQAETGPRTITRQEIAKALKEHFDPEFLGRFSKLVSFNPISKVIYSDILLSAYEAQRLRIEKSDPGTARLLPIGIDAALLEQSVATTFLPDQGARPAEAEARRLIEEVILAARFPSAAVSAVGPGAATVVKEAPEDDSFSWRSSGASDGGESQDGGQGA